MISVKPRFKKPGDDGETAWREDRTDQSDELSSNRFVYNPRAHLAMDMQRQRLPIYKNRPHIIYILEKFQTLVIVGETGCGKSTQIPQYLVEAGWGNDGRMIGITQPRRVAATTLASRVAEERGVLLGDEVGYSIRFDDCYDSKSTKIKYMTEGILIREMMGDPLLSKYCVLMLDEVHERSIDTDIVMGLLRKIIRKRNDLRLIVSSATVDAEDLRDYFNTNETKDEKNDTATILSVSGRAYSVDVFYSKEPVPDYVKASVDTALKIHQLEPHGDILIFLTGLEEVDQAVNLLSEHSARLESSGSQLPELLILPLYGSLTARDQLKVFKLTPDKTRKIVVATNIAEASVTISGIVYVIDCGFVKMKFFNPNTATDTLAVVPVSQASSEQRAGRAGRVRSGKCYRLYPESEFEKLDKFVKPEMQRSSLAQPLLQLKAMGIDNILRFHFPAAPPSKNVVCALELLYALGALDNKGALTNPLGSNMAEFPLHPMFSKCLLVAGEYGCTSEIVSILAMLQVQNVFIQPGYGQAAINARKAKRLYSVAEGDHITLLNVYDGFIKYGRTKQWCSQSFVNYRGMMRASEIRERLLALLRKFGVKDVSAEGDVDTVCRCLTAGFFANAAYFHPSGCYKTVRGDHELYIHPTSVLYTEQQPSWVVFGEVLHTTKEYMRDVTVIDYRWLSELAPHYYVYGTEREIAEKNL